MRSTKRLVRTDGSEQWLGAKSEGIKVAKGDLLYFNTWGGGGWGDPLAREPALVKADVDRDLVTVAGARRYGVVLAANGSVDEKATHSLREKMRTERGDVPLFNFGGSIEEIRARCKAETHLDPPRPPTFAHG
jgi:N-methylhydantoinase B